MISTTPGPSPQAAKPRLDAARPDQGNPQKNKDQTKPSDPTDHPQKHPNAKRGNNDTAHHIAPPPQQRRDFGPHKAHPQSPSADCQRVSAATAAVSALRMRGPRLIRVTNGRPDSRLRSASEKPPSGPIRIAHLSPPAAVSACRAPTRASFAIDQLSVFGPVCQHAVKLCEIRNLRHERPAALFCCFNRMGLQPIPPDAFGIGKFGLNRANPRCPHLRPPFQR